MEHSFRTPVTISHPLHIPYQSVFMYVFSFFRYFKSFPPRALEKGMRCGRVESIFSGCCLFIIIIIISLFLPPFHAASSFLLFFFLSVASGCKRVFFVPLVRLAVLSTLFVLVFTVLEYPSTQVDEATIPPLPGSSLTQPQVVDKGLTAG